MKPVGLDLDSSLSQQGILEASTHHYPITLHSTRLALRYMISLAWEAGQRNRTRREPRNLT